ncbi:Uma2 family endonuclease [Nocardia rhizosphaerae]|uniref:Uma2 family endonuclease n=1 Tax=Nocardia rhizosphaerae TaxID=1691571 RepID=A0ABV8KY84_9NOCA
MANPHPCTPDLPEFLTWEELEQLPEEIAEQIELWDGRVVWVRRGPAERQVFTGLLFATLRQWAAKESSERPENCYRSGQETNVFLDATGKSNFLTPDFLVHRCIGTYQDLRAADTVLVGEVLSPSNTSTDIEAKKARYATAGIPWYWEVHLARKESAIATVRAYALETSPGDLPAGVRPLRPANYLLVGEWTPADEHGIEIDFPFPIRIPWTELAY